MNNIQLNINFINEPIKFTYTKKSGRLSSKYPMWIIVHFCLDERVTVFSGLVFYTA